MTQGWSWPILRQGQTGSWCFCMGKKGKIMDLSKTFVVYAIKVGRFGQLNEYMNLYEYQKTWSFIDFRPRSLRFNIFKFLLLRNRLADWSKISYGTSMGCWERKSVQMFQYRRRVVSLSKRLYSPKVLVNYLGSGGSVATWLKNCWLGR